MTRGVHVGMDPYHYTNQDFFNTSSIRVVLIGEYDS